MMRLLNPPSPPLYERGAGGICQRGIEGDFEIFSFETINGIIPFLFENAA